MPTTTSAPIAKPQPPTTTSVPSTTRPSRGERRLVVIAVALVAFLLLGNGVAFGVDRATGGHDLLTAGPRMPFSTSYVLPLAGGRVAAASLNNEVAIVSNGAVTARHTVEGTIGGLAAAPDGGVYVGTSTGAIYTLSSDLAQVGLVQLDDLVVAVAGGPDGELVVGHGSGAFSSNYFLSRYASATAAPRTTRAQFTITELAMLDDTAIYGTINSRVASIGADGKAGWTVLAQGAVTALTTVAGRGWILTADQTGTVTLIDRSGATLGTVQAAKFPLTAIAFDPSTGSIVVGDQRGTLHVLDDAGKPIVERTVGTQPISAITTTDNGNLLVVGQDGTSSTLDVGAIGGATRHQQLVPWWVAADIALSIVVGALLFLASSRRRRSTVALAHRSWAGRLGFLFVLPTIVLIVVFSYYPAISSLYYSFTDYSLRTAPAWVGTANFRQILFHDAYFHVGLLNMLIITVTSFLKAITVPLLAAELVYWLKNNVAQYLFRTLFVLSTVVPALVLTLLWKRVYDPDAGALNEFLRAIGLGHWARAWLGDDKTALWAVIGVGFPYLSAFAFLILLGGLLAINRDLYDSAAIDGASRRQQFVHIDLAHLRPQLRILAFFAITGSVEGFAGIFLLTAGGPGSATYVPALEMYLRISGGDLGYASAIGAILFVTILLVTIFVLRFRRQEAETA